jgi:RNA polymerase sigma factor (sigma-70 family)
MVTAEDVPGRTGQQGTSLIFQKGTHMTTQNVAHSPSTIPNLDKVQQPNTDARAGTDPQSLSDRALVRGIEQGKIEFEAAFVKRFDAVVTPSLRKLTRNPEEQRDLYQDTFIAVLTKLRRGALNNHDRLASYICRTAQFIFFEHLRSARKSPLYFEDLTDLAQSAEPSASRQMDTDSLVCAVRRTIGQLPAARDRQLLWCHYVHDQDKAPVASRLGLSLRHFDRVSFRARARLRKAFVGEFPEFVG